MLIKVFGSGCCKCSDAGKVVAAAVQEAGVDAQIEKVTDFKAMMALGIMATPAVAIDGKVMCTGRIPSREEVLKWLGR